MIVLIISHVHFLREALMEALCSNSDIDAHEASSHETIEAVLAEFSPTMAIVEASHPDGMALVAAARACSPKMSVIVLAMQESDAEFLAWADIGIAGYLGPDTTTGYLVSTMRRAAAGDVVCPPRLTALLLSSFAERSNERTYRAGIHALTTREREIAELLAEGMSNKLIARRLSVALPTVKNHVHSILDKWDVRTRGEAAARFRQKAPPNVEPTGGKPATMRASHVSQTGGPTLRNGNAQHRATSDQSALLAG